MDIKKQYEQDGYNITEYTNGTVVKELISEKIDIDLEENISYNKQDVINAKILTQLEYLTCLQELNSTKGGNL